MFLPKPQVLLPPCPARGYVCDIGKVHSEEKETRNDLENSGVDESITTRGTVFITLRNIVPYTHHTLLFNMV
jgi:hypothetical protein